MEHLWNYSDEESEAAVAADVAEHAAVCGRCRQGLYCPDKVNVEGRSWRVHRSAHARVDLADGCWRCGRSADLVLEADLAGDVAACWRCARDAENEGSATIRI